MLNETLLNKEKRYLVGVSGGVDSMALLDLLVSHGYQVVVLHMNYHFRHDSDIDEQLVRSYCQHHDLAFYVRHGRRQDYVHTNFEMKAREMRYQFYYDIGQQLKIEEIILAHHFDDDMETIIMQLQRHNTEGYLGIKAVSKVYNMDVIRPLLKVRKAALKEYCINHHVAYHDDYTNEDMTYTRNRIRHQDIKNYDLEQLSKQAEMHNQRYLQHLQSLAGTFVQYQNQGYLKLHDIARKDLRIVIYHMIIQAVYPPYVSKGLIDEVIKQLDSSKPNIEMNLPVNAVFIKEYDNIRVDKAQKDHQYCFSYDHFCYDETPYYILSNQGHLHDGVCLSDDDFPVTIRNYRPGDKIKTSGGTKKVSRLFIDRKISKEKRKSWPILLNRQNEIILIPHIAKNIEYLYTKPNIFVVKLDTSK